MYIFLIYSFDFFVRKNIMNPQADYNTLKIA